MSAFPYDDADSASARLLAEERQGGNAPALSISEIAGLIKRTVEDRFGYVRLRGEISGYKRAASGHVYLSLKDENARIDGVMWKGNAARLAFRPEDGLEVIASGKLTTYPGRSSYQIVIDSLEIAGEGALMALFEKTKMRLTQEGLFDAARKQALPHMPRTIGVVTSPTGAVIRDILHRLADRFPTHVIVWPVLVQGQGAAQQVAAAIRGFDALPANGPITRPDLLIVARGGGSIEDLWSFNEEIVVRAIADCTIPVISAVGHETDTTLADYAADMRAPTPTAAAEMAVPVLGELAAQLGELRQRSLRAAQRTLALAGERLTSLAGRLPDPVNLLAPQAQRVDDLGERLWRGLQLKNTRAAAELARAQGALRPQLVHQRLAMARQQLSGTGFSAAPLHRNAARAQDRLSALSRLLDQLDPAKPLARGYAMVLDADGGAVTKATVARKQSALTLKFGDGDVLVHPGDAPPSAAKVARPRASSSENGTTTQPKLL